MLAAGNTWYFSGQIAIDPVTSSYNPGTAQAETHQIMKNLKAIIDAAGGHFDQVVKTSIFLHDMGDFAEVNEEYGRWFGSVFPARETVQVSRLPKDARVEISMIVYLKT